MSGRVLDPTNPDDAELIALFDGVEEEARAIRAEQNRWIDLPNVSGVYVYSLPHYLTHPYHADGRTLLKVGRADYVVKRLHEQVHRITALPERPVPLRIYWHRNKKPLAIEQQLHRALVARGHPRHDDWQNGQEWFVTDLATLDELAGELKLVTKYRFDP
jgi:hypothetical protein